jgi:hypothetical protein
MIKSLPYYADASPECIAELTDCLGTCVDLGDGGADELTSTAASMCWETGFNGTCDGYARGHKKCPGGTYEDESSEQCHALCESTDGAWTDDLDLICVEACD